MVVQGNKVPLFTQLALTIQQRVRTGIYQPGDALPPVRLLSKEFNVSQGIVQQAIRKLEAEGIVKAHHGKGVLIQEGSECERVAILFGLIHPYHQMGFHRDVLEYVDEAFAERSNFVIVRSSKDDPTLERQVAEHLIANGVKGLIVWPTVNDPNGEFFTRLSRNIPVVLVDRLLPGADLPSVIMDYFTCGQDVSEVLLGKMKKKRLLVVMDNLQISSYQHIAQGIEAAARELKREKDLTIIQLPISRIIQKLGKRDYSEAAGISEVISRIIHEGQYDAVFCPQDDLFEYVMIQTGAMRTIGPVQVATFCGSDLNVKSLDYIKLNPLEWRVNQSQMISCAGYLVQRWVLSRQMPKEDIRVKLMLVDSSR